VLLAAIVGVTVALLSSGGSGHRQAKGSLTITGGGVTKHDPCVGVSNGLASYADLRQGLPVVIYGASGTILGNGALGAGQYDSADETCTLPFAIDVTGSSDHYQIQFGNRDPIVVSDLSNLALTIGP
jgi:hypothetical protein